MTVERDKPYRVGSEFCYAEFATQAEADEYFLRAYPHIFIRKQTPVTPKPWLCRAGLHKLTVNRWKDGGFTSFESAFCVRCRRGYSRGGSLVHIDTLRGEA